MIKAIIFDCFGVLYSSGFRQFMNNTVPEAQREAARELFRAYDKGLLTQESLLAQVSELIDTPVEQIKEAVFSGYKLDQATLDYVSELHGRFQTSILSNLGKMTFKHIKAPLLPHFDDFLLSYDTGLRKPDHRVFLMAAERLRVAPGECVFVDDDPVNCEAAANCGMKAIVFTNAVDLQIELDLLLANANDEAPLGTD